MGALTAARNGMTFLATARPPTNAPSGIMTNPDFNTGISTSGWQIDSGPAISGGKVVFSGNVNAFFYQIANNYLNPPVVGYTYRLSFLINTGCTGTIRAVFNATSILDTLLTTPGLKEYTFVYTGGDLTFNFQDKGFVGSVEWCQLAAI